MCGVWSNGWAGQCQKMRVQKSTHLKQGGSEGEMRRKMKLLWGRCHFASGNRILPERRQKCLHHLRLRHVQFFNDARSFLATNQPEEPKVILAVPYNMAYGPSRKIFTEIASDAGNLVVLPSMGEPGTLSHELFAMWNDRQTEADKWGKGKVGDVARIREELSITVCHWYMRYRGGELTLPQFSS